MEINGSVSQETLLRQAYASAKEDSDRLREKSLHFYNEKRADGLVSALGRTRQYTRERKDTSLAAALLRSPLAVWAQIHGAVESVINWDTAKEVFQKTQAYFFPALAVQSATAIPSHGQTTLNRLSAHFQIETQHISDALFQKISHLSLKNDVAARDIKDIAGKAFIGPLPEDLHTALEGVDNNTKRFEIASQHIKPSRVTEGLYSVGNEFALTADQLQTLRSNFGNSNGSVPIHVLRPIQSHTSITPADPVATNRPTPVTP
ncbi:MAG: hypothetical protein AAF549_06405 [Pseudomonadota bacterium]